MMPKTILVMADASGPGYGGVPVYNQRLLQALVAEGHAVTLMTVEGEYSAKGHENCDIRAVPAAPVVNGRKPEPRETLLAAVRRGNPASCRLPDAVDLIIGHSRFSGPAAVLAKKWYPRAKAVWVLHTNVERLGQLKGDPLKKYAMNAAVERLWMPRADIVVGPGPLLTSTAGALAQDGSDSSRRFDGLDLAGLTRRDRPHIHEMVTGTDQFAAVNLPRTGTPAPLRMLLLGRATDPIKGMDTALQAVRRLRKRGIDVRLHVRGVAAKELDDVQAHADRLTGSPGEGAKILPFTHDEAELADDVKRSHLVVVPSLNEGFPLTALEALGRGVPVLVNQDNGVADFFYDGQRVREDVGPGFVVKDKDRTPEARVLAWEQAILRVAHDYPRYASNAATMRDLLTAYGWGHAADSLVKATCGGHPRGARTVQSASGAVTARTASPRRRRAMTL
ncbi:glycosyltransferase family 4 protein [Streptomyces sp. NPDC055709]